VIAETGVKTDAIKVNARITAMVENTDLVFEITIFSSFSSYHFSNVRQHGFHDLRFLVSSLGKRTLSNTESGSKTEKKEGR